FEFHIPPGPVERDPSQRSPHLETSKSRLRCSPFALIQNYGPDPAPHPIWVHKECPNLGRIHSRIQQRIFPGSPSISAVQCPPLAPSSARDDHWLCIAGFPCTQIRMLRLCFHHEISPIGNQLAVHSVYGRQRTFDLGWRVVLCLQSAH